MIDSRSSLSAQRSEFWSQFTGKERDVETGLDYFYTANVLMTKGHWIPQNA